MSDDRDPSLEFEQVVERFADSERALRDLEERIRHLGELDERLQTSADGLEQSAATVDEYVEQTREYTSELADVAGSAGDLLERAREVLDGTQLQRIEELMQEDHGKLERMLSDQDRELDGIRSELTALGPQIVSELDESERLDELRDAVSEVDESVDGLGPKLVSELQHRLSSVRDSLETRTTRLTWIAGLVLVLQAVLLGVILLGGA